ncbi:MAG: acyltransferase family protein [Catenibacillus sp.]
MKTKNYGLLDVCRIFAAILVIAIHIGPLEFLNKTGDYIFTGIIARIGVPFFLMITGYFVIARFAGMKADSGRWKTVWRFIKKTGLLYTAAMILYLPVNIYAGQLPLWTERTNTQAGLWIFKLFKFIFVDGTFYHLWYFPAVIFGVAFVCLLLEKMSVKAVFAVSVVLYGIGLLGDSYYGLVLSVPVLASIYDGIFTVCEYTRNGLFYVPVFLMLGCMLAGKRANLRRNGLAFGLSMAAMITEGLILYFLRWQRHDSMYIFLIPAAYTCFGFLLAYCRRVGVPPALGLRMRNIAMLMYVLHPLVLIGVRGMDKILGLHGSLNGNGLMMYVLVTLISAAVSSVMAVFMGKIQRIFQRRHFDGNRRL